MGSSAEYNRQWRAANREGYRAWCKANYAANPNRKLVRNKAWRDANPNLVKKLRREYVFGEGAQEHYETQLANQGERCAICNEPFVDTKDTHQDHNHDTDQLRGVLCSKCNPALGGFRDSPELLRKAAAYLEAWRESRRPDCACCETQARSKLPAPGHG